MSNKKDFIEYVSKAIENYSEEMPDNVKTYWELFTAEKVVEKPPFTDNGKLILGYLQEHSEDILKAKSIGEGLNISSRTVSGAIRKLVTDGYVTKVSEDPVVYQITEKGKAAELN